jgi:D-alanyl-D-alanine carboxypeptidase
VPSTTSRPDPERAALLAGILESHHAAGEFVGGRIAFRDRDGTITEVTAGTQTVDATSPPVDLDVPWNIGSATKTFVAVVVLQLADEGVIELDGAIEGFFPDLADAERITPRQLLQHTSGLNDYKDLPAVVADAQREWTTSELIAASEAAGRVGEPGGAYHYSNTNYILLGEIIEQVTGHSWAAEVRTRIVEPLGLSSTDVLGDESSPGYGVVDGGFVDATMSEDRSLGGAAGGLQSTGRDLLRFLTALADGTLLSAESQAAMHAFVPGDDLSQFGMTHGYGLGLEQYATDAVTVTGHLGTGMQGSFIGYDAEHATAVAVMINTRNPESQGLMAIETLTAVSQVG